MWYATCSVAVQPTPPTGVPDRDVVSEARALPGSRAIPSGPSRWRAAWAGGLPGAARAVAPTTMPAATAVSSVPAAVQATARRRRGRRPGAARGRGGGGRGAGPPPRRGAAARAGGACRRAAALPSRRGVASGATSPAPEVRPGGADRPPEAAELVDALAVHVARGPVAREGVQGVTVDRQLLPAADGADRAERPGHTHDLRCGTGHEDRGPVVQAVAGAGASHGARLVRGE